MSAGTAVITAVIVAEQWALSSGGTITAREWSIVVLSALGALGVYFAPPKAPPRPPPDDD